jgi:hypothetical protein
MIFPARKNQQIDPAMSCSWKTILHLFIQKVAYVSCPIQKPLASNFWIQQWRNVETFMVCIPSFPWLAMVGRVG